MKDDHCHSILTFWYTRQTNGVTPTFRFNRYLVKDEIVEALPRETADVGPSTQPAIPSGRKPDARNRGKGRRARRRAKSSIPPGDDIHNISSDDDSEIHSNTPSKRSQSRKSRKKNKGKEKARDIDSGKSSKYSTSSSESEPTTTTTNTTEAETESDSEDSLSDRGSEQSRGRLDDSPHLQSSTQPFSAPQTSPSTIPEPTVEPSHVDDESLGQPDDDEEDEDMLPSEYLDLGPELMAIAQMVRKGMEPQDISARVLQAFGSMQVKSQSQSPIKQRSPAPSPVTGLRKRRERSSTEGLPPVSPTKKSRLQSLDNSVEASPESPTTDLRPSTVVVATASTSQITPFASTDTAPDASSTRPQSRGNRAQTIPRGDGRKGQGSKKQTATRSPRITRSNSPKKRSTRAHPT